MDAVAPLAPTGEDVVNYDRQHLALYAALIEADDAGSDWRSAATSLIGLDVNDDGAHACWRSHLERARWIIGAGLGHALVAFATPKSLNKQG